MKNTFIYSVLVLLLFTILSCTESKRVKSNVPNNLKNTFWIIANGGIIQPEGGKEYLLNQKVDSTIMMNYQAINFSDEQHFVSFDSWECGNDCFTTVYGRYYLTSSSTIEMEVDSISKDGTCQTPIKILKPAKKIVFNLVKNKNELYLTKK